MRSVFPLVAVVLASPACLLRDNPEFGVDASSSSTSETTGTSKIGSTTTAVPESSTSISETSTTALESEESSEGDSTAGSSGVAVCEDAFDPNDDERNAEWLGQVVASAPTSMLSGSLGGPDEWDWYRYRLVQPASPFNPSASSTGPQRVCVYVECAAGPTTLRQCGDLGEEQLSPEGRPGCCAFGQATTQYECMSVAIEVDVYMALGSNGSSSCDAYDFGYRGAGVL